MTSSLAAVLEHRVRQRPGLHVGRPDDELIAVPEADALAVPLRHFHHVLLIDQDLAHEIVGDAGRELDLVRRHEHLDLVHRELGPPAHEAFGIAERGHPLRGVRYGLVIAHLNEPLLILGRQQRYEGRGLQIAAVGPLILACAAPIPTVPVRHRGARVLRRAAARLGCGLQRRVVLGGRRVRDTGLTMSATARSTEQSPHWPSRFCVQVSVSWRGVLQRV